MAHRSIFNDPSPANSDGHEQDIEPDHVDPQASDQIEPNYRESPPSTDDGLVGDGLDDNNADEEERGDVWGPDRFGDHEDTYTTVKPFIGVLASLDRDHNIALSKHLYSAHLLRKQNSTLVATSSTASDMGSDSAGPGPERKRQKRTEHVSDSEEGDDKYLFDGGRRFLTKQWTSWPHPPSYVPRETDPKISRLKSQPRVHHFDPDTYELSSNTGKENPASSQMLEETLVATFLKFSRDKFRSRPAKETNGMTPALDDDMSQHILKPVVRHIISQLDGLLTGLYHERGYTKTLMAEDRESMGRRSQYIQAKVKGMPWVRKKLKAAAASSTNTEDEDEGGDDGNDDNDEDGGENEDKDSTEERGPDSDDSECTPPKKAQKAQKPKSIRRPAAIPLARKYCIKRHNRLGLRDWSQVLGIAALTGWEEDPLQKTVERCETQFDQTMSWRRLKESDLAKEIKLGEVWTGARLKRPREKDKDNDGISNDGFMQPINIRLPNQGSRALCVIRGPEKRVNRGLRRRA